MCASNKEAQLLQPRRWLDCLPGPPPPIEIAVAVAFAFDFAAAAAAFILRFPVSVSVSECALYEAAVEQKCFDLFLVFLDRMGWDALKTLD